MSPRRMIVGLALIAAAGLFAVDLMAPGRTTNFLGSFVEHQVALTHVVLRTLAVMALLVAAFARFGVLALVATPLVLGPLLFAALPPVTGDEPHYLMITVSLETDHDVAIANNDKEGDGAAFGYPALGPSPGAPVGSDYSLHYPGTAVLALPGWVLGGRRWALLGVAVVAALLVWEMVALARVLAPSGAAVLATAMVMFTPPVLLLSRQIYPDIPGALCLAHLARLLAEREVGKVGRRLDPWTAALAAGAAPWLHSRLLPGVAVFLVVLALRRRALRVLPPAAFLVSLGLLAVAFERWYGSPLPTAPYVDFPVRNPSPGRGLVGMLADSHAGLVLVAPVVVVALVMLPRLWRTSSLWSLTVGAVVLVAVAQNSAFRVWHAGGSTPARPWASLLPLATPAVALAIDRLPKVMAAFGLWTAAVTTALVAFPWLSYPAANGLTGLWARLHLTFLPVISAFDRPPPVGNTPLGRCALLLVLLAVALATTARAIIARGRADGRRAGRTSSAAAAGEGPRVFSG